MNKHSRDVGEGIVGIILVVFLLVPVADWYLSWWLGVLWAM